MSHIDEIINAYEKAIREKADEIAREYEERYRGHIDPKLFAMSKMSVPEAARLRNVDVKTIRNYMNRGVISKHPDSTDAKPLICAMDVLLLDFKQLRKRH